MSTAHSEFTATGGAGQDEEGYELTSVGGDWDDLAQEAIEHSDERIVVNMGPQHPSTHGVLRLILELDAETVTDARVGIGYLHTGIEKNMEYRSWTQGVTFCTRMDYLTPLFQEAAYCLAIEKLLGITDQVPERANVIRVLMMELNRIGSHLVCTGTGGMELGATTVMEFGFRERERILRFFEAVTGLRMNHAYIRPGGVIQDVPAEAIRDLRAELPDLRRGIHELELLINEQPILKGRMENVGYLDLTGCMALGVTGPMLRATGGQVLAAHVQGHLAAVDHHGVDGLGERRGAAEQGLLEGVGDVVEVRAVGAVGLPGEEHRGDQAAIPGGVTAARAAEHAVAATHLHGPQGPAVDGQTARGLALRLGRELVVGHASRPFCRWSGVASMAARSAARAASSRLTPWGEALT